MEIAHTIKRIRLALCLEQQEFAKLLGISKSSASLYEKGLRNPRLPIIRELLAIAKKNKIKVSLDDFLSKED